MDWKPIIRKTTDYVNKVLGLDMRLSRWGETRSLPVYLTERYELMKGKIFSTDILLVIDKETDQLTPSTIEKQLARIMEITGLKAIYLKSSLTSYDRKRLMDRRISFIVPDNQMFLPYLGMDLRERMVSGKPATRKLSAYAQCLILHMLQNKRYDVTPSEAARILGCSVMTMTRAFKEYEAVGIGAQVRTGKARQLTFTMNPKDLWEDVLPYLYNPVMRTVFIQIDPDQARQTDGLVPAGESALADQSMLAAPDTPVYAMSRSDWKIKQEETQTSPYSDSGESALQVWIHPIVLDMEKKGISPFALYLSLMDNPDERIQGGLKEMMERVEW